MSLWADNFWQGAFWADNFWVGLSGRRKHTVTFESSSRTIEFVGESQRSTDFESASRNIEFSST